MIDVAARAAGVRVIAFDVDGICTDGRLYYGAEGEALHAFHARDGLGLVRARLAGLVLVAVTGRLSRNVAARLTELKIHHVLQGVARKDEALATVLEGLAVPWEQCLYIGDDVNDLCCLQKAGLACTVPDAADDVAGHAHLVTRRAGGQGALREVIEMVMKAQGTWVVG